MRLALVLLGLIGCGRLGFDPIDPDMADAAPGDSAIVDGAIAGLVGWWKLDETTGLVAADSSGLGLTGTLFNNPVWVPMGGRFGGALSFGPQPSFVVIGQPAALANLAAFSVSAWVNASTLPPPGSPHCIVDKGAPGAGWYLSVSTFTPGDLYFFARFTGTDVARVSTTTLAAGSWQHVVATWNGGSAGSGIHYYIDGIETSYQVTDDGTGTREDDAAVDFGINCLNATETLEARIDDVRIYSRELSAAEVFTLATGG